MSYICDACPIKDNKDYSGICDQCKPYSDRLDKIFQIQKESFESLLSGLGEYSPREGKW